MLQPKSLNFDAVHEIEEILLEEPPLRTARSKRTVQSDHQPVTEEAQWRQMLEDKFLPFDYRKRRMVEGRAQYPYSRGYTVISGMEEDDDDTASRNKM